MSLDNGDGSSATEVHDAVDESPKKAKNLYTRDFLLSLSELEECNKLPSGFDQSILSEFEDASHGIQDRPRVYSSLPFRRNDYSSSPPTRGDSSNLTRGVYGRRDNRASGWSDKDSDSQSDLDSDSGRRTYGNQSRRSWQNSEHDGLLGSGSFPRPAGYAAGHSALKGQTNEHSQLNRSNLPYQPPRPFKVAPHSRPNTNDSFNDETFGFSECTSQDKAEEERKRRASFELMRKEQQKVLQEKQKLNANKHSSNCFADLLPAEAKEEELSKTKGDLDSANLSISSNDSAKASFPSQSSTSRPLVPPGFRSTVLEKHSAAKPLISSTEKGNSKPDIDEIHVLAKGNPAHPEDANSFGLKISETTMSLPPGLEVSTGRISGLPELHEAVDGEVFELPTNKVTGNKLVSNSSQDSTPSILGKLFGSAQTIKNSGLSGSIEQHENNPDDSVSSYDAQSSKFAQWFHKDEKKPMDNLSSGTSNDLLSLIVGGEKSGTQVPNVISTEHTHLTKNITSAPPVAAVLTCEDLEQTILSEYSEKSLISQPLVPDWSGSAQENTDVKAVDDHATHHLLSLLQKGISVEDTKSSSMFDKSKDENAQNVCNSGPNLMLETLFGTDFMKELQSAAGSARTDPLMDDGESNKTNLESNLMTFDGLPVNAPKLLKQSGDGAEIRLPEEESLFAVSDNSGNPNNPVGDYAATSEIAEKLAALNSGFGGERFMAAQVGPRVVRGPYDLSNPERQFNNVHAQVSSPQMTHNRTMFDPSDPRFVHMRFPEHLRQHDMPNHQFPANMLRPFHHPDSRETGFDIPANPQMLTHMQMPGNFPHHLLRDFSRPSLVPPHPGSQPTNFMPHRFIGHQPPNIGGLGMPPPSSDRTDHQEAFQRMMELRLRAQVQPSGANHSQGMYGHELDMGFQYR